MMRRFALGLVVAGLVVVTGLAVLSAVAGRGPAMRADAREPAPQQVPGDHEAGPGAGWVRVASGSASYAVPTGWQRRPAGERIAYREDSAVIASGRGYALAAVTGCPVAWAALADPVRSSNVAGVVRATALAWARGYAGLPEAARLRVVTDQVVLGDGGAARRARVQVDLGRSGGCAGERAELTAVSREVDGHVVTLVVARYLDVDGAPDDATYDAVLASLRAG